MYRHAAITAPQGQGSTVIRTAAQMHNKSIEAARAVRHILFEAVQYARKEKFIKKSPEQRVTVQIFLRSFEPGDLELTRDISAVPARSRTQHQSSNDASSWLLLTVPIHVVP